jgi:hypothetical protein
MFIIHPDFSIKIKGRWQISQIMILRALAIERPHLCDRGRIVEKCLQKKYYCLLVILELYFNYENSYFNSRSAIQLG